MDDEEREDIKNENKKRDEADEKEGKGFTLSEQMKEDLILLVAIILILCLTFSIVGAKVPQYCPYQPHSLFPDLLVHPSS